MRCSVLGLRSSLVSKLSSILFIMFNVMIVFGQWSNSGDNQTYFENRMNPKLQYAKDIDLLFVLTEDYNNPGSFRIDTMTNNNLIWGEMPNNFPSRTFIVENNGTITFALVTGNKISLLNTDLSYNQNWEFTHITGISVDASTDFRVQRNSNGEYLVEYEDLINGNSGAVKMNSGLWTDSQKGLLTEDGNVYTLTMTPYFGGIEDSTNYMVERFNGVNEVMLDTTIIGIAAQGQLFENPNNELFISEVAMLSAINFNSRNRLLLVENDQISLQSEIGSGGTEEIPFYQPIWNSEDQIFYLNSSRSLGPHGQYYFYEFDIDSWYLTGDIHEGTNYSYEIGNSYSLIVDKFDCVHVAYDWNTDVFWENGPNQMNCHLRKYCAGTNQLTLNKKEKEISVFPNPVESVLEIQSDEDWDKIKVINSFGELVFECDEFAKKIDLSDLNSGFYILKIQIGKEFFVKKIVLR